MKKVSKDFQKVLEASQKSKAQWDDLTPLARRDFVRWIESAKQEETRKKRIKRACEMLAEGKRRPCCYAVIPMNLYKALGENPKAKAHWGDLSPVEKRDFVDWIESSKKPEDQKQRTVKVCEMLAAGKRHY